MYEALKDQLANAKDAVRIGEVNQDATSGNITGRGMGFINKFKELAEADGKKVAVVGNEYYVNLVENNAKAVSYTHLDVYKRQGYRCSSCVPVYCGHYGR